MTTDQVLSAKCKLSWNRNLFTCCQGRVIRNVWLLNTTDLNWFHPSPIKSLSTAKCQSNSFVDFDAALLIRTTLTGSMKNAALSECQYIASCVHSPIVVSLKQKGMAYEIFHWCYKAMLRYRSHQMSCSFYLLYYRPIFGKINIVMQNLYLNLHVGNLFGEPKRLNKDTRIFSLFFARHILTVK